MIGNLIKIENKMGLSEKEVSTLREKYGKNIFEAEPSRHFLRMVWDIVKEPMFILLVIACSLYFILGSFAEGLMMVAAILLVSAISLYQEVRSSHAIHALRELTEPGVKVIRDGVTAVIASEELVPGDLILLEEGMKIPADAIVESENDLSVNESIVSGESMPVEKNAIDKENILYQGTTINSGKCTATVTATGSNTVLGKLGKQVLAYQPPKTLLQVQINKFVNRLAFFGLAGFFLIFLVNYLHHQDWATSLLFALTLALSAIPEEIPVAFSSFMALGAHKMSKLGIISRQPQIVENLGAVSVICLDKTGTITENKMQVKTVYDYDSDAFYDTQDIAILAKTNVLFYAVLASERNPFDAMEKGIWEAYLQSSTDNAAKELVMVNEYPLEGRLPMMTHIYERDGIRIAAAKGAVERILGNCNLSDRERERVIMHNKSLATRGYRVIGVSSSIHSSQNLPKLQDDFNWRFEGLVALYDPPKKNIPDVFRRFYDAKIEVKLITGDFPDTAMNIAGQVGILNHLKYATGSQIMSMKENEMEETIRTTNVYARMFPEAKLKVVEALKAKGDIVAMTGDGVNDGPALKAASIGIAMGKKGTEIARQASDLILTDDNLERMVTAISEGRKIFTNLKKAIRYIISIHIPIILTASLPVILGWQYPNIFTPIHVIFMELIMGPTCSIFFEREPVEGNTMLQKPRGVKDRLFTQEELAISILQGLFIAGGTLFLYYYFMSRDAGLRETRTIVFTTLLLSNVLVTFVNRSNTQTLYYTARYKNGLAPLIIIVTAIFLGLLHWVPFVRNLFELAPITDAQFWACAAVAFVSVIWIELVKVYRYA